MIGSPRRTPSPCEPGRRSTDRADLAATTGDGIPSLHRRFVKLIAARLSVELQELDAIHHLLRREDLGISIAPPISSPMAASVGANRMPA
jgi:hypothetical protein